MGNVSFLSTDLYIKCIAAHTQKEARPVKIRVLHAHISSVFGEDGGTDQVVLVMVYSALLAQVRGQDYGKSWYGKGWSECCCPWNVSRAAS